MGKQGSPWGEVWMHFAAALGYALGFMLLREVSFSHWVLFAGFRLSALLLVPYRYWPALIVGELVPLGGIALSHADRYGALWSTLFVIPPIALAMPVVWRCRHKQKLFPGPREVQLAVLVGCTFAVSVIWSVIDLSVVATARLPSGYPKLDFGVLISRWFVGNFLGVLTVVPLVLFIREAACGDNVLVMLRRVLGSKFFVDAVSVLLPALAFLVWIGTESSQDSLKQAARIAMFFPVVWLSLRYGWHGAAVGGTASSIAVVLTMPAKYDLGTLQAQVFIAFSITTMLLLGERIAHLHRREMLEKDDAQWSMALARRTLIAGELQLRQTSTALEHVREAVQLTFAGLLDRLRATAPTAEDRDLRRRAAMTQQQLFRLADSLHPVTWRDAGFSSALRHGAIARALDEAGIRFWPCIDDRELTQLSESTQIAVYRLACDLIALSCSHWALSSITLRVRAFRFAERRSVVTQIYACKGGGGIDEAMLGDLFLRLASTAPAIEVLRDRVALFEGRLNVDERDSDAKVSFIVIDPT